MAFLFEPLIQIFLTLSRQPASVAGLVWNFAKSTVFQYLDQVQLDLAPPITDLRSFLAPLFHPKARQATQAMLDSLHGGDVTVGPDAVVVQLLAEVQEVFKPEDDQSIIGIDRRRTATAHKALGYLGRLSRPAARSPWPPQSLSPEDRQILIDVLLDTRYAFVAALEQPAIGKDFVRMQFVRAWQQLAPIFRRQLYTHPSDHGLGYLTFFTAADAFTCF